MTLQWSEKNGAFVASGLEVPAGFALGFTTRAAGDMLDGSARKALADSLGAETLRVLTQVHGTELADPARDPDGANADGWLGVPRPGELLAVKCADCLPLLLWSGDGARIAAVHAGWRGATAGIAAKAVAMLGGDPASLNAALGPAIGNCCYEVGEEVACAAKAHPETLITLSEGKYLFDLAGFVREDLLAAGLISDRINALGHCTVCRPRNYASHRATKAPERQCGFIGLVK